MLARMSHPTPRLPLGILLGALLVASLPVRARAAGAEATEPASKMEIALQALVNEGPGLDFRQRYVRLARIVASTHDFERMAAAHVGARFADLDEAARKRLEDLLFKRVVAEYARHFDSQSAPKLALGPAKEEGEAARVELREDDRPVLSFRVTAGADGAWRIDDVRWEGQDPLEKERQENERVLVAGGVAALEKRWTAAVPLPGGGADTAATPKAVVQKLQDGIVAIMKDAKGLGYEGRYGRFEPLVRSTHDLDTIAELALARHWNELDTDQKKRFTERFDQLAIARYAGRFDGYSGERFEILDEKDAGRTHTVRSALWKSDGQRVLFDWALRKTGGAWRILNITVDGVSDLATKQAEYGAILEGQGFDALMAKMAEQIRRQETGS